MEVMRASKYWDDQAAAFDAAPDHGMSDLTVREAWAALLLPLLPTAPARVADLGCGTGTLTVLVAQAGHLVSGLDFAPRMVALAREKIAAAGVAADVVVGDASSPPWKPGTFDVVLTRHVLWAMPDLEAALATWIDLLAPGGGLVLIEGRWSSGVGLTSADVAELVLRHQCEAEVTVLDDPALWGGPIGDERYVITSRR
jgi:SAM-dependent methyltransferase